MSSCQEEAKRLLAKFDRHLIWHLNQLKLKYNHHQQPQQHSHYDELDPFRSGAREPSQHFVEATHGQPPDVHAIFSSIVNSLRVHFLDKDYAYGYT